MDTSINISAAVFGAYLKCPTKAYLVAKGEHSPDTFFADMRERISATYKAKANQHLRTRASGIVPIDFLGLRGDLFTGTATFFVDCETVSYADDQPSSTRVGQTKRSKPSPSYVPTVYSAWNKIDQSDTLLNCFGAMAIEQVTGTKVPPSGQIIYGEGYRSKTVRVADQLPKVRRILEAIVAICRTSKPPPLVLNKHCTTCDFQSRCHPLAVERDDLSLLDAMSAKERAKCEEKGISTITQLSYGYRPRRRRRIKSTDSCSYSPMKHDHKLKALAIKKAQTHVVGSPLLSIKGTPVFMDVEGLPDREFYYLIGIRYEMHGEPIERSFWANGPETERDIWQECLHALRDIENPILVHYGAYESRFLKHIRRRWKPAEDDAEFFGRIAGASLNVLASMYGRVYFPTYSNSLKDIASWLGFEWSWPRASGAAAILLRRCWELTSDDELRRSLITYNMDDCRAAGLVTQALTVICGNVKSDGKSTLDTVDVSSLEVGFRQTFGKFQSALPEFEQINTAAYWDYQTSRVYARSGTTVRHGVVGALKPKKRVMIEKEVTIDRPVSCSRCGSSKFRIAENMSRVIFDLNFSRRGIRRCVVRYRYKRYKCAECRAAPTILPQSSNPRYGLNLHAYVIYLLIEMRLSAQQISDHMATVFSLCIFKSMVNDLKVAMAKKYNQIYQGILEEIARGPLVHADETKGVVPGGGHYIWVFANQKSVAYVYAASREATILENVLKGFAGVLVSDFYAAYDSVPCPQQKCLIHLMRDINNDILSHPFNEELRSIATRFGRLLREIIETVDRYGLKKRHLGKHKPSVEWFLSEVASQECTTEVLRALKNRIIRNRDRLFVFLDYNNVPWNNNSAEHAVKVFTRMRNQITISTPKGMAEYCTLLTVQQTLKRRGVGFLDFLRSGKTEIDART